jgi:ABC-type enterobactin transport system permease subunit
MLHLQQSKAVSTKSFVAPSCVIGACLIKLAKHLTLMTCLLIIGEPIGRFTVSQLGLFLMVLTAAVLHAIGRVLQCRLSHSDRISSLGP